MITLDLSNFGKTLSTCIDMLKSDLNSHAPFDPNKPYENKNFFANNVNSIGISYLRSGQTHLAEVFYENMLRTTLNHERATGQHFHLGYFLANLGIAQIRNGKYDVGISHLLAAETEDKKHPDVPPGWSITESDLWKPFKYSVIFPIISQIIAEYFTKKVDFLEFINISSFFDNIPSRHALVLQSNVLAIRDNLETYRQFPNDHSLSRLYMVLRDICVVAEDLLRKYQIDKNLIKSNISTVIGTLLEKALKDFPAYKSLKSKHRTSANTLKDFLAKLENILSKSEGNVEINAILCLELVRNFTGHHFEFSGEIVSIEYSKSFADYVNEMLANLLIAMFFLKSIEQI